MVFVAVGWQMYDLTRSAFALGLVGLVSYVPMLLFVFLAGHAADRYDRRTVARVCQAVEALALVVLCTATARGAITPGLIYAMLVVLGTTRSFESPAVAALLPNLLPAASISAGTARMASAQQTATIVGPAMGGLLYAVNPAIPYGLGAAMFALAAVAYTFIRLHPSAVVRPPVSFSTIFAGLQFIRATPEVLGAISLDLFAVLLGGATALLPIYARDILFTGPWGLGLLRTAPAVGALATAVFVARQPIRHHAGRIMFAAVALFGASTIVFGLSRWFPLSFAALMVLGASDVISVVIRSSLVAIVTPDAMRGRVNAVNSLFIGTSNQLGEFESGTLAAIAGPVASVVLGGIGSIAVALIWLRLFPSLARIDALNEGIVRT
jgi:MFS family permease